VPFQLTPAEEQVRKIAREYTEREIIPIRKKLEKGGPAYWWEECARQLEIQTKIGFHLLMIPKEDGGTGLGFVARSIAIEEVCAGWPGINDPWYRCEFAWKFVKACGGEVEKKWLPKIIAGKARAAPFMTEPGGGSDVMNIQTTAKKVDGGWVINGRKCFISGGDVDFGMVLTKTGDPADPKTRGTRALSAFIVEKGMQGFKTSRMEDTVTRKQELRELVFDNVFVPDSYLVQGVGRGLQSVLGAVADIGRMNITAHINGIILGAFRTASLYAKERKLYGKPLAELQGIQFRLAEMAVDLETTRALTYRAGWLRNQGINANNEMAIAKWFATNASYRDTVHCVCIHGTYGVLEDYMPQRYYRDAPVRAMAGGTDEAMKNMISGAVLEGANPDFSSKNMLDAGW
jgi:alkylation response protein AidB-like acyl-CoA dehydrogenase